jgi:hypothetical protein
MVWSMARQFFDQWILIEANPNVHRLHINMRNHKIILVLSLQLVASFAAQAQSRFEQDFDDDVKSWQEIATQIPAIPQPENLIPFYVSAITTIRFAIDSKSLSIGSDGVVRYTLVSKTAAGAENISYEGIRCQTSEVKLYAFGHKDGTWGRSHRDKWTPIVDQGINRQHAALVNDYFCDNKIVRANVDEILDRMRSKRPFTHDFD